MAAAALFAVLAGAFALIRRWRASLVLAGGAEDMMSLDVEEQQQTCAVAGDDAVVPVP